MRDVDAFAYNSLLFRDSELSGMDESEASDDVKKEWKQDGTTSSRDCYQGVLHQDLAVW